MTDAQAPLSSSPLSPSPSPSPEAEHSGIIRAGAKAARKARVWPFAPW
jgi:hypothetical protein